MDEDVKAFSQAAADLSIPLKIIIDPEEGRCVKYAAPNILVRPDQFIAWLGDRLTEGAEVILRRAIGHFP